MSLAPRATRQSQNLTSPLFAWAIICLTLVALGDSYLPSALRIDAVAVLMAGLTLFVGGCVLAFSRRHMRLQQGRNRFFLLMAATLAAILSLVLTDHILVLVLGWTASGFLLARLIGHAEGWAAADQAARRARTTFAATDCLMVCMLALAALHLQTLSFSVLVENSARLPQWMLVLTIASVILAALARCAVPPFSPWLLVSATAPTPVSALMHAGLVNAGGYLLIRFAPMLELVPAARIALVAAGLVGALVGAAIMIVRPDIKRSLAASTISQMGFMIMTCGLGAYAAALWHIVAHGLFKAWLFLGAGQLARQGSIKGANAGSPGWTLPVAMLVGLGMAVWLIPLDEVSLVPTALALVTALFALMSAMDAKGSQHRVAMAGLVILLMAIHAAGLGAVSAWVPAAGSALPVAVQMVVMIAIVASLVVQHQLLAGRLRLPARIYVRLINAGRQAARPA